MTSIEFALLIIILVSIVILINQKYLAQLISNKNFARKFKIDLLRNLFSKAYSTFQKARRFSLIYIFKNKFYLLYLIMATGIVIIKILLHYHPQLNYILPIWISKSADFLIVSSSWEIVCIVTKMIDDLVSKK